MHSHRILSAPSRGKFFLRPSNARRKSRPRLRLHEIGDIDVTARRIDCDRRSRARAAPHTVIGGIGDDDLIPGLPTIERTGNDQLGAAVRPRAPPRGKCRCSRTGCPHGNRTTTRRRRNSSQRLDVRPRRRAVTDFLPRHRLTGTAGNDDRDHCQNQSLQFVQRVTGSG